MADIKVKQSKKGTIKSLNKAVVGTEKIKNRIVETKEKVTKQTSQEENISGTNYAVNKISNQITNTPYNIKRIKQINRYGKENFVKTKQNINIANQKIKYAKRKNHAKKVAKNMIKTAEQTNKNAIKTSNQLIKKGSKETIKLSQKAIQSSKFIAQKVIAGTKVTIKATASAIKAMILSAKALITALLGLGWVAILIIIVMCIVGAAVSIFYHGDENGNPVVVNEDLVAVAKTQIGIKGRRALLVMVWLFRKSRMVRLLCFLVC